MVRRYPNGDHEKRIGQYMGNSEAHAITVGLVRNIQTGSVSPQFHVIYDDSVETVHSSEDSKPLIWEELLTFSSFRNDHDVEEGVKELQDEWLDE